CPVNGPIAAPPFLLTNIFLVRGQRVSITFDAVLDDLMAAGEEAINTVCASSVNLTNVFCDTYTNPVPQLATVGDYVWLDENSDGIQDAGEAGIANATLFLLNSNAMIIATTTTDTAGGYLFSGLLPGPYTVQVDPASLPPGLAANQTFDLDATAENMTTLTLASGEINRAPDFGYNWSVDPLLGALGDRIWIDADGDGIQDAGEAGLPNVTVTLFSDPDGDGVFDTPVATNITDDAGQYIFDDLPPDAYVVVATPPAGYTQTGDPDGALDNQSTLPIVIAPGDVYVNADFGYQPAGPSSAIGDTIFFDADADGVEDPAEPGIPGVTVALYNDVNGNGALDSNDLIVASTVTDTNGMYVFPGLPADDYIVWVNDTAGILDGTTPTADPDGGNDNLAAVTTDGATDNLDQDFGYTDEAQTPGQGLIGDMVFIDRDADGSFDPGEGLAGVVVELFDASGMLVGTTTTDANGFYSFAGLDAGTYTARVDVMTLPPGLNNTVDPDGGNNNASTIVLAAGGIDLDQDFG
ncbi:MAG: SdrD B-like domain-containing protein, partial [Verrucomicrobiota bacterium]